MFVKFEYEPIIEDFYSNGEMKIETILKILENSGNKHSDIAGNNILEGSSSGSAWILTDWYVEIDSYPKYGDKVYAITWSQGAISLFGSSRDFELYCNDKLCVKGTTRWVHYDLNAKRPAKITEELISKYEPETKSVFEESKLPKIDVPENYDTEIVVTPRRNDIDFNHHVHNLVYIDYAMESIPLEVYNNHNFKNIRITYKSAVKSEEKIKVKSYSNEKTHTICIYGEDDNLKTLIELTEF